MSKRTVRKPVNVVGAQEDEFDEADEIENTGMETAIKDFADGERYIKLYRHPTELTGGRPRLLCAISREEFNDVNIQEKFGGGKYFGRWRRRNGQYTRFNFDIDGEPKVFTRAQEEEAARRDGDEGNPYGFLNRGQQRQQRQQRQQQDEQGNEDQDRGIGTADILRIMAETRRESREEMRMLLELMRPAQQAPDATEKVFSLVEKIVPLITQGGNDGSGGNPWLFALAQLKDPLMKIVDTIHTAVTKPPQAAPTGPLPPGAKRLEPAPPPTGPEPPPPVTRNPSELKSEDEMLIDSFKDYLPMLTKAASESRDPELYAELVLDQIPRFAYDRLRVWLLKPGCLDDLAKLDAAIYNQRGWWDALRGLLIEALNEELGHGVRTVQPDAHSDPPGVDPTPGGPAA